MTKTVLGIFIDRVNAEDTIDKLRSEGFDAKDISLVMQDKRERDEIINNTGAAGTTVADGAVSGMTTGALIGGLAGFLAGTAIPALAGLFIAGPIGAALGLTGAAATTVSGAATGAVAGGLIGALVNLGVPEETATRYQERVHEGAILIAVPAANAEQASIVSGIFDEFGASDVQTVTQASNDLAERSDYRTRDRRESDASHAHFQMGAKGGQSRKIGREDQ